MYLNAVKKAEERLKSYNHKTLQLSYGNISFMDEGKGETIITLHGLFGGYDQGFDTALTYINDYRVIAPSRFGYLGSDFKGNGTVKEQAEAIKELMDKLGLDKVYILGTSAGGPSSIKLSLMYPERVKGLILYSVDLPPKTVPQEIPSYIGPPEFIINGFPMYISSPFFESLMGLPKETIHTMLPVNVRKKGIINDGKNVNTDYLKNNGEYILEDIKVPVLIFSSKDDKLINYEKVAENHKRIKNCTLITIEKGGHLLKGSGELVKNKVREFIESTKN